MRMYLYYISRIASTQNTPSRLHVSIYMQIQLAYKWMYLFEHKQYVT
jgi:hypothetical protein